MNSQILRPLRLLKTEIRKLHPELPRDDLDRCFNLFVETKWDFMKYMERFLIPHRKFFANLMHQYAGEDLVPLPQFLPGLVLKPVIREDFERACFLIIELLEAFDEYY